MSSLTLALARLRPGVSFSNTNNTLGGVRWSAPLPDDFTIPTQDEVDVELSRQNAPVDHSDLDKWDRKLRALALVLRPATGMTLAQFKAALKAAHDSLS